MQNQDNINNIYTIINPLDNDAFSSTYLVRNENNHNHYVAKVMNNNNQQLFNRELQMTTIVSGLNNPNIIHLDAHGNGTITFGGNVQNNRNYFILDYHQRGSLFNYIKIPGRGFTELHAKYIFDKILRAVQAIHGAGICHRDLKLENILLDQNYNPVICDFSLATNNNVNALNDFVGYRSISSPQILNQQVYNGFKADIFSLGALLFNLVAGIKGFNKASINDK
jgi:serine/threonine protein kinase